MATITELRPIKRRVLIMVDGRHFACVPAAWIAELELNQFDEVDVDELEGAVAARQFEGAYAYALDLLERRGCVMADSENGFVSRNGEPFHHERISPGGYDIRMQ